MATATQTSVSNRRWLWVDTSDGQPRWGPSLVLADLPSETPQVPQSVVAPLLTYVSDPCSLKPSCTLDNVGWYLSGPEACQLERPSPNQKQQSFLAQAARNDGQEQPHHGQDHGFPHPLQPAQWAA